MFLKYICSWKYVVLKYLISNSSKNTYKENTLIKSIF